VTDPEPTRVLFLCTGNATRSLIAARLLERARPDLVVASRGTLVVEGVAPSHRTRAALASVGVDDHRHASRQLRDEDLRGAGLVVGFERYHVEHVRRTHPQAASRTATLRRLVRDLPAGPPDLAQRLDRLDLARVVLSDWEDVSDPAGGAVDVFVDCAAQIRRLVAALVPKLD
jgi:protein-tyrosine-phosphatase